MEIRKLVNAQEWFESDKLLSIAFLHDWNEKEAMERFQKQENGEIPRSEEAWGLFSGNKMEASVVTNNRNHRFQGKKLKVGELHMVGTLPEARGQGHVRELIRTILTDYKKNGYPMAMLIPFSCSFYRKYGFEVCSNILKQKVSMDQFAGFRNELKAQLLEREEDVEVVRKLYDAFVRDKNLAYVKTDEDYAYRGDGQFGEPDFFHADNRQYTYLFYDEKGTAKGYLKFIYVHGPDGPFVGDMHVQELVYDSPETFRNILGFIGSMSAKLLHVCFEMIDDLDLTNIFPEGDRIERSLDSHIMMRALDIEALLSDRKPLAEGVFTIEVEDAFLTENTGVYEVTCKEGASEVKPTEKEADLVVSIQTFTQMITGKIGLKEALYREGTILKNNKDLLEKVFVKQAVALL